MLTRVRFLPCMSEFVIFQMTSRSERILAHITGKWFLPCVCAYMFLHATFLRKWFTTMRACMRFFSTVNSHVEFKMWWGWEQFVTHGTLMFLLCRWKGKVVTNSEILIFICHHVLKKDGSFSFRTLKTANNTAFGFKPSFLVRKMKDWRIQYYENEERKLMSRTCNQIKMIDSTWHQSMLILVETSPPHDFLSRI